MIYVIIMIIVMNLANVEITFHEASSQRHGTASLPFRAWRSVLGFGANQIKGGVDMAGPTKNAPRIL